MSHLIFCDCCESANVELKHPPTSDSFYMCNICREYCYEKDIEVKHNSFKQEEAIDYSN